jgi:hypothetical protein
MEHKISFLKNELTGHLENIPADRVPAWGKMNPQQMVEHLSRDAFRVASGKVTFPLMTPEEHIPKMQEFLRSDKQFKENTVNKLLATEPVPVVHQNMSEALTELRAEIDYFFETFQQEPGKKVVNPSFGEMDFELQVLLLHKHALHHLRQFGVETSF